MEALANDGAVVPVLTRLLSSSEAVVRKEAALAIASLSLVYQGRMAADDAKTVAALSGPLREDEDADVRAACAKALESLTSSRDGCSVVMGAEYIVARLTTALDACPPLEGIHQAAREAGRDGFPLRGLLPLGVV